MSSPSSSSAHLEVLQGPWQGRTLSLSPPETVVGRETAVGLSLSAYREVSRRHARFYLRDNIWCVEDLGSTNGTFVNGTRAAPSFSLNDGTLVQMGDFQARFREMVSPSIAVVPGATQFSPQPSFPSPQTPTIPMPPGSPPQGMPMPTMIPYPVPVIYPQTPPKNPGLAAILSFLFGGLGQIYNGEMSKGIPMLIIHLFAATFSFFCCIGAPFLVAAWIWSIVDAYQSAERINRELTGKPY